MIIIYSLLALKKQNKFLNDMGSLFYGISFCVAIGWLLLAIFFFDKIYEKLRETVPDIKISKELSRTIQITTHLLPMILAIYYAPKTTTITQTQMTLFLFTLVILYLVYIKSLDKNLTRVYSSAPVWVFFPLFIIIVLFANYLKYGKRNITK